MQIKRIFDQILYTSIICKIVDTFPKDLLEQLSNFFSAVSSRNIFLYYNNVIPGII